MNRINRYLFYKVLIVLLIIFFNSVSYASENSNEKSTLLENTTIVQLNYLLSGQLKDLVSYKAGKLKNNDHAGIRTAINTLLDNTNKILITSYRERSEEYRRECDFLFISIVLDSFLDRLDKCISDCTDVQLDNIKYKIKFDYDDLRLLSSSCSQYLEINQLEQ